MTFVITKSYFIKAIMKLLSVTFLMSSLLSMGCNFSGMSGRNLSKSNIELVELTFPKGLNQNKPIKLDSSQFELFANILSKRHEEFVNPNSCYTIYIQLKDGGSVNYLTDGINFKGFDDSSDLPFSFKTTINVLSAVFKLEKIDSCKE